MFRLKISGNARLDPSVQTIFRFWTFVMKLDILKSDEKVVLCVLIIRRSVCDHKKGKLETENHEYSVRKFLDHRHPTKTSVKSRRFPFNLVEDPGNESYDSFSFGKLLKKNRISTNIRRVNTNVERIICGRNCKCGIFSDSILDRLKKVVTVISPVEWCWFFSHITERFAINMKVFNITAVESKASQNIQNISFTFGWF